MALIDGGRRGLAGRNAKKILKNERLHTFNLLTHLPTLHFHDRGRVLPKNLTPQKSPYADSLAESNCYCS